jgi:thymidylate synthase
MNIRYHIDCSTIQITDPTDIQLLLEWARNEFLKKKRICELKEKENIDGEKWQKGIEQIDSIIKFLSND